MGKLQDYLTKSLSNPIEEDDRMRLHHALLCYGLVIVCLAHKDMLETERSETEKKRLCEELEKAMMELVIMPECEKPLAAKVEGARSLERV
ncbi:hypothetical protein ACOSP7_013390 [Xanthoceras sorbifolium]